MAFCLSLQLSHSFIHKPQPRDTVVLKTKNTCINKNKINFEKLIKDKANDTLSFETGDLYYGYADVLRKLGKYKEANAYLVKFIKISNGINYGKNIYTDRDGETKYQIGKLKTGYKQKEELAETDHQTKYKKMFYLFIALMLFSFILFYFFNQNTTLKHKNKLKINIINATIDGQEMERKKIAGILHDSISAQLSSAGLHLSAFSAITQIESEELTKTKSILKEAHDKVRDLSHDLLPTLLSKFGVYYALKDLCEKNSNSIINIDFSSKISQKKRYNEEYEVKVYFIIAELFNNIIKHSEARFVNLIVEEINSELVIYLRDNGKGFDTKATKNREGHGLTQIRARTSSMNGKFIISSSPNKGTSAQIKLPLQD